MKCKLFYLAFFLISLTIHSQTNIKLDQKNGFRHIKLGSSPTQIKNIIRDKNELEVTQNNGL